MKFAASNIALPAYDHLDFLPQLSEMGLAGLEVAPSRIWHETWHGLMPSDINRYRTAIDRAGLSVVGLHSLFYDQQSLGLFSDGDLGQATLDYLVHLSLLCRDLGGQTLIYGGGRWRKTIPLPEAKKLAIKFFEELIPRIETHGTIFCFEPLGNNDSDFINSIKDSLELVNMINHPALKVQIDSKAMLESAELNATVFEEISNDLVHVHVNEPDLGILGSSGKIDNQAIADNLRAIDYKGFVSIEQRMVDAEDPIGSLRKSVSVLKKYYK